MNTPRQSDSSPLLRPADLPPVTQPRISTANLNDIRLEAYDRPDILSLVALMDDRQARLYAIACVERVLPILDRAAPGWEYPAEALNVARRFAEGEATSDELRQAEDAAWDAVGFIKGPAREVANACAWTVSWDTAHDQNRLSDTRELKVLEAAAPCLIAVAMNEGKVAYDIEVAFQKQLAIEVLRGAFDD